MRVSFSQFDVANGSNELARAHGLQLASAAVVPDLVLLGAYTDWDADFGLGATATDDTNTYWDNASGGTLQGETIAFKFDHSIETYNANGGDGYGTGVRTITETLTGGAAADTFAHGLTDENGNGVIPDIAFVHGYWDRGTLGTITRGALTATQFTLTDSGGGGDVDITFISFHSIQGQSQYLFGTGTLASVANGTNDVAHGQSFTPEVVLIDGTVTDNQLYWTGTADATNIEINNSSGGPITDVFCYFLARHSVFASV